MHQSHINIPQDKDLYAISWFLSGCKCEHDWIRLFDHDGCGVQWFTCPFTGHTPWNIDCDYKGFQVDDLDNDDASKRGKRKAKRAFNPLANVVEHTSNCTIKDDIMVAGKTTEVTPISQDLESQLKDVLF
ncbi:hypothetical protein RDI58_013342 [Solanum bulbocastanum]|uniref:Uncharacterized protein n=1 Tax=Solanum bulbocastanum TaxID=147425 RepID=A0AAN8TQI7_SOLBU